MKTSELQFLKSGLYFATTDDGKELIIGRQEGHGWSVSTPTHDDWYETVLYTEDGDIEGVTYEK